MKKNKISNWKMKSESELSITIAEKSTDIPRKLILHGNHNRKTYTHQSHQFLLDVLYKDTTRYSPFWNKSEKTRHQGSSVTLLAFRIRVARQKVHGTFR